MTLPGLSCAVCASPDLIAVAPGSEPDVAPGGIMTERGVPVMAWCAGCHPAFRVGRADRTEVSP